MSFFQSVLSERHRARTAIVLLVVLFSLFAVLVIGTYFQFSRLNKTLWEEERIQLELVQDLALLQSHLGYGGAIHEFQSYLLTGNTENAEKAEQYLTLSREVVERLDGRVLPNGHVIRLPNLGWAIVDYSEILAGARQRHGFGSAVDAINAATNMLDAPAQQDLQNLTIEVLNYGEEVASHIDEGIRMTQRAILTGALALPVFAVLAIVMIRLFNSLEEARKFIRASGRRRDAILAGVPAGIAMFDDKKKLVFKNRQFNEFLEFADTLFPPQTKLATVLRASLDRGDFSEGNPSIQADPNLPQSESMVYEHKLGSGKVVEATRQPLADGSLLVSLVDVTERIETERYLETARDRAIKATAAKSAFVANISHEIRTPMNAIMGLTRMVLQSNLTLQQRDYLSKLLSSASSLLDIINDVLDFSKIEAGKMSISTLDFNLSDILENMSTVTGTRLEDKHLDVAISVAPDVHDNLRGDPMRLTQILTNLMTNAVKFTPKGQILLEVTTSPSDDGRHWLNFSITDSGIGLTEEQLSTLFTPFTQADDSSTRQYGGTGLGLSICKELVGMMGGGIGAESTYGKGSCFHFCVPFDRSEMPDMSLSLDAVASKIAGLSVMVVDDISVARTILAAPLRESGADVIELESGIQAIERIAELLDHPDPSLPDVILMDSQMPFLNGLEAMRRINDLTGPDRKIPCLLVTAYTDPEIRREAEAQSIQTVLQKPLAPSLLMRVVASTVSGDVKLAQVETGKSGTAIAAGLAGERILLVEDNEINQLIAQKLLTDIGLEVDLAVNGLEALQAVEANGPSYHAAVLMDIQMPVMDGHEATQNILSKPEFSRLPIIAMTAHALESERELCLANGMCDHLSKPIDPAQLYLSLSKWVQSRNLDLDFDTPESLLAALDAQDEEWATPTTAGSEESDNAENAPAPTGMVDPDLLAEAIGCDRSVVVGLMEKFVRNNGSAAEEMRRLVGDAQTDEAAVIAHTVKGVAANLRITPVSQLAAELETLFRAGGDGDTIALLLSKFESTYSRMKEEIRLLTDGQETMAPKTDLHGGVASLGDFPQDRLDALRDMLSRGDMDAEGLYKTISAELHDDPPSAWSEIGNHIDQMDYPTALTIMREWQSDTRSSA